MLELLLKYPEIYRNVTDLSQYAMWTHRIQILKAKIIPHALQTLLENLNSCNIWFEETLMIQLWIENHIFNKKQEFLVILYVKLEFWVFKRRLGAVSRKFELLQHMTRRHFDDTTLIRKHRFTKKKEKLKIWNRVLEIVLQNNVVMGERKGKERCAFRKFGLSE